MSDQKENLDELIERYLDGELSQEESDRFRNRLNGDAELTRQVDLHKELRANISKFGEHEALRAELEGFHQDLIPAVVTPSAEPQPEKQKETKVVPLRTLYRVTGIAASVAILASFGLSYLFLGGQSESEPMNQPTMVEALSGDPTAGEERAPADTSNGVDSETLEFLPTETRKATAFAVSRNGYLVTSGHFARGANRIAITMEGDSTVEFLADVVEIDPVLDVALLKIVGQDFEGFERLPYVFGSKEARLGEEVFAIGFPGDAMVYGDGAISALEGNRDSVEYQVTVPLNKGNSGCPLVNSKGEVVGIITSRNNLQEGAAYATKAQYFLDFVEPYLDEDNFEDPVVLPRRNYLKGKRRPDQVERLKPFVFEAVATYQRARPE